MAGRDIVVIGGSAGAVQVLMDLMRRMPPNLPAAVMVAVHTSPSSPGILPDLLDRAGPLTGHHAFDGESIRAAHIYVAPPDHHLTLADGCIRLSRGPRENGFRPAIDPLFRTAAREYGSRVIGIILSGGLDDGTEGMLEIKRRGGVCIAQNPDEAMFPSMPNSAIQNAGVDYVLNVADMPAVLTRLVRQVVNQGTRTMARPNGRTKADVAELGTGALQSRSIPGPPSGYTCPECGGALWELKDGELVRYRCHVGHGYTADALLVSQTEALEAALWTALRALEENASMRRRMAERSVSRWPRVAEQYEQQAREAEDRASLIRGILLSEPEAHDAAERPGFAPPAESSEAIEGAATPTAFVAAAVIAPPSPVKRDGPSRKRPAKASAHGEGNGRGNGNGHAAQSANGRAKRAKPKHAH